MVYTYFELKYENKLKYMDRNSPLVAILENGCHKYSNQFVMARYGLKILENLV